LIFINDSKLNLNLSVFIFELYYNDYSTILTTSNPLPNP
jgi:hypothetical protein